MIYVINPRKVIWKFLGSCTWIFLLLAVGFGFLLFKRTTFFFIIILVVLIFFLPLLLFFLNHLFCTQGMKLKVDMNDKVVQISRGTYNVSILFEEIRYIEYGLSASRYSGTSGVIQTPWEDFFFITLVKKNNEYFRFSYLLFDKKYLKINGIDEKKRMVFFPIITKWKGHLNSVIQQ